MEPISQPKKAVVRKLLVRRALGRQPQELPLTYEELEKLIALGSGDIPSQ